MRKLYLDSNLQLLFGVSLTAVLGVSSIVPVLPTLMQEMDVSPSAIGLVVTVFAMPGIVLAPIVGVLADRIGRKKILIAALVVMGSCGTACAFADSFETLLVLRFMQGMGAGPLGVLNPTIICDLYSGRERTAALGYAGTALSIGAAGFPAVGGALAIFGWRFAFLLPLAVLPLALLIYLFLDNPEPESGESFGEYLRGAVSAINSGRVLGLCLISLLSFVILYGPFVTYVPVLLEERFDLSPAYIGAIVSVSSLFTAVAASQIGRLCSLFNELSVFRAAFILWTITLAAIPALPSPWAIAVGVAVFGLAIGMNFPVRISLLTALAPPNRRAALLAVNSMLLRFGQTIAPVLSGLVLAGAGIDAVFWAGAGVALVMLGVATWLVK